MEPSKRPKNSTSISVRLSEELHDRIGNLADSLGLTQADVIRMAVESKLEEVDEKGFFQVPVNPRKP